MADGTKPNRRGSREGSMQANDSASNMQADRQATLQVLGLKPDATDDQIRTAYKFLQWQLGPMGPMGHFAPSFYPSNNSLGRAVVEEDEDEDWDSDDEYESEYDEDDEGEEDDDDDYLIGFDPFAGDIMDYALFMRMYGHLRAAGQLDGEGRFSRSENHMPQDNCYCPKCQQLRREAKLADKPAKQEAAKQRKAKREAERAEAAANEELDKKLQKTDPKNSLAWKRGGESREKLIREHFLAQTPSIDRHYKSSDTVLWLNLRVSDLSLLLSGKVPPKGVDWEVQYREQHTTKWIQATAAKDDSCVALKKLTPGTMYEIQCRTGLSGSLTWSGSVEWGPWGAIHRLKTSGKAPANKLQQQDVHQASASKPGNKKKKKNRDAAFEKLTRQEESGSGGAGAEEASGGALGGADSGQQQDEDDTAAAAARLEQLDGDGAVVQEVVESDGSTEQEEAGGVDHTSSSLAHGDLTLEEAAAAAAFFGIQTKAAAAVSKSKHAGKGSGGVAGSSSGSTQKPCAGNGLTATAASASESLSKHIPKYAMQCMFYTQGRCTYGSSCKFRHSAPAVSASSSTDKEQVEAAETPPPLPAAAAASPAGEQDHASEAEPSAEGDAPAAAAAAARDKDVAALDKLLPCVATAHNVSQKTAHEAVKLAARIAASSPAPRYQPAPITEDGLYLRPLFLSVYDVSHNCYAAWYRGLNSGGSSEQAAQAAGHTQPLSSPSVTGRPAAAIVKARMAEAMRDQHMPLMQQASQVSVPQPASARHPPVGQLPPTAAQQQQHGVPSPSAHQAALSSSSSQDAAAMHRPKYTSLCRWYPQGTCKFGNRCAFVHYVAPAPAGPGPTVAVVSVSGSYAAPGIQQQQQQLAQTSNAHLQQQQPQQQPHHVVSQQQAHNVAQYAPPMGGALPPAPAHTTTLPMYNPYAPQAFQQMQQ